MSGGNNGPFGGPITGGGGYPDGTTTVTGNGLNPSGSSLIAQWASRPAPAGMYNTPTEANRKATTGTAAGLRNLDINGQAKVYMPGGGREPTIKAAGGVDRFGEPIGHYRTGSKRVAGYVPIEQARNAPLSWSRAKLQREIERAKKYGYADSFKTGDTLGNYMTVWAQMVQNAQAYATIGKKVSPFDTLALLNDRASGGPVDPDPTTSVTKSITHLDAAEARNVIDTALHQYLGRSATDQEKDDFLSRANGIARKNPTITTTVSDQDAFGNSTSTSDTTGGVSGAQIAEEAKAQAQSQPDYGTYQAATRALPAIFKALDSPV